MVTLTVRDNSILKALFDPESSSSTASQVDERLPSLPHYTELQFATIRAVELSIIRRLDTSSIEQATVTGVIHDLSALIERWPQYASAYANRAQSRRLLLSVKGLFSYNHAEESGLLLSDLGRAIELATPRIGQAASQHQSQVLAAGYAHRGSLLLRVADRLRKGQSIAGTSERIQGLNADEVEELASGDFAAGGRHGNKMAQEMSVRTNPYAKMCGAIVKEAMRKEIEESNVASHKAI